MQKPSVSAVLGVMASSAIALAQPAEQQPDDNAWPMEVSAFTGVFLSNFYHQFYDLPTAVTRFGSTANRPVLDGAAPQFGLRYAYLFSRNFGAEADASWTVESTQGMGEGVSILHYGISALGQLPIDNGLLGRRTIPFAELGWGIWDSQSSALGNAVHFPVHGGVGVRYFLTDTLAARLDFRYYRGPSNKAPWTLDAGYAEFGIGISWTPHFAPRKGGNEQVGDRDGDGIPDDKDACPNEPEDKDMFLDDDGCPDLDNDGDGIPDDKDKCPLDPEDYDGFQDQDGCPDTDNDGDSIPDTIDQCPNEPEDKDGFQDLDGCPDPDNDGDGIADIRDKCPNEPETINGVQDDDGCPDRGDALVVLSPERLELLEPIQFDHGDKVARRSANLLGQIGATLRAHPEIVRLRITSYVQPSRDPDHDQALSDKRAAAVREWLVQWGVDDKRLVARGFGGTKPLVSPDQKGAAAVNDRLELIILERR